MKKILITIVTVIVLICGVTIFISGTVISDTPSYAPQIDIYTDKLGCTWLVAYGRLDGGVAIAHHPTCRNTQHQK